ncbi:amidohydrolase family protein [Falsiroseomonas sp.]|uniref:amidohydrolase family protein n=1 Tax=Falsiroseomonas sp. TaxID=2870721 RepID=UPI003F7272EC
MQQNPTRCVVVQPSTYGTDNACLLDALGQLGRIARGVAVVDGRVPDAELRAMDAAGVRGLRFNMTRIGGAGVEVLEALAKRVAPLGWHLQLHTMPEGHVALGDALKRLPLPLVIDHLGRLGAPGWQDHPAWALLRGLVDAGNTWVKLSGAYHDTRVGAPACADTGAVLRAWQQAAPQRVVWGTDWPHPAATTGEKPLPDDAQLLDLLADWVPSETERQLLLVDNPASLCGFAETDR